MMDLPDILAQFVPKFETLFMSVKDMDVADLTRTDHPFGWLLTVLQKEYADKEEIRTALMEAVTHLDLYLLILHRRPPEEHEELKTLVHEQMKDISHKEEGEAMAQTMAEYLIQQGKEEGEKSGEKRGEKRGETRAKRESLLKLLELRFDTVPEPIISKISAIRSLSRLDSLFEQAVTAQTLDEIDWENR